MGSRGSRCISMPNFIKIGESVVKILNFFNFSRWRSFMLNLQNYIGWRCLRAPDASLPNFVKIGHSLAEILRFFRIFKMAAATIVDLFGAYLHHPQWVLGVSITLQNLVMIDAVVFVIWTFQYLVHLAGKRLLRANWSPIWAEISTRTKKAHPCMCLHHVEWSDL